MMFPGISEFLIDLFRFIGLYYDFWGSHILL